MRDASNDIFTSIDDFQIMAISAANIQFFDPLNSGKKFHEINQC